MLLLVQPWLTATMWMLLAAPAFSLVFSWVQFFDKTNSTAIPRTLSWLVLAVLSFSYAAFLAGVRMPGIVGPDYSSRRFITIVANLALSLIIFGITFWRKGSLWNWITVSAELLVVLWGLAAVVSGAV